MIADEEDFCGWGADVIDDDIDLPGYIFKINFRHRRIFEFDYFLSAFPDVWSKTLRAPNNVVVRVLASDAKKGVSINCGENISKVEFEDQYYAFLRMRDGFGARLEVAGNVFVWSDDDGDWAAFGKRSDAIVVVGAQFPMDLGDSMGMVFPTGQAISDYIAEEFSSQSRAREYSRDLARNYLNTGAGDTSHKQEPA